MCQSRWPHFARRTLLASGALFTLSSLLLFGCGRNEETPAANSGGTSSGPAPAGKTLKVALVTAGSVSDAGWNAGAFKALQTIKAETGAEVQNVEAKSATEHKENLSAFASKKFDVVFGHGAEFEPIALEIEKDFPNTQFFISSGRATGKNTTPIIYQLEDGAYLLGMLAAGMSKTNKLASVGAMDIPPVKSVFAAFEAGAKAVKPDIVIIPPAYTGSWEDVGKAKQQTLALLDQGADIIMQDVDAAAVGIFEAVEERAKGGKELYALGTNNDQNSVKPGVVLASAPIFSEKAWVGLVNKVKAGNYKPSATPFGLKDGVIDFILNPQLESKIPADLKKKLDETKQKIKDGSFVVPKG